jgi:glutamate synthase domain-containing protein 1
MAGFEELAKAVGLSVLLWRKVPVDSSCLGSMAAILFYFILFNIFRAGFEELAGAVGLSVLLWREVPVDSSCLGSMAAILFYFILFNIQGRV